MAKKSEHFNERMGDNYAVEKNNYSLLLVAVINSI